MGTYIKPGKCKCGEKISRYFTQTGTFLYCHKVRFWNFWKHDKTRQIAWTVKSINAAKQKRDKFGRFKK
jgi:hypothetical protein